jgi:hypothetical protein
MPKTLQENLAERLSDSVERLYLKPGRPARKRRRRRAANQNDKPDSAKPASA